MGTFCPNPKSICKKLKKKLQKSCKKIAKILQKVVVKNLKNFCRFFAEFLQLHILQKVLHFRPREMATAVLGIIFSACKMQRHKRKPC